MLHIAHPSIHSSIYPLCLHILLGGGESRAEEEPGYISVIIPDPRKMARGVRYKYLTSPWDTPPIGQLTLLLQISHKTSLPSLLACITTSAVILISQKRDKSLSRRLFISKRTSEVLLVVSGDKNSATRSALRNYLNGRIFFSVLLLRAGALRRQPRSVRLE